jgi:outer membrane protein, heavy metal efflux system
MKTVPMLFGLCLTLAGCVSLPLEQQQSQVRALVDARQPIAADPIPTPSPGEPLRREDAIALALMQSPRAAAIHARLGLARADALAAMRLANPAFSFSRMTAAGSSNDRRNTRSLGLDLADALLLPVRRRFAAEELARQRLLIADQLLDLAYDAESLWWQAVAAQQIQHMREAARDAADASAKLAERFHQAGNISQMQWQRERAVAAEALIAAGRAEVEALRLRGRLGATLALDSEADLKLPSSLPLPPAQQFDRKQLFALAEQNALQLAAAHAEVTLAERGLRWQRRWRWLGAGELAYEREHEGAGVVLRGPSLALSLPIFHQNQAEVAHAQAALALAQAELNSQIRESAATIDEGIALLRQQQRVIDTYREVLLQAREMIVGEQQARYNFMLIGAFELIEARRAQYDGYEAYIEAIRDGWLARIAVKRAVGSDPFEGSDTDGDAFDTGSIFKPAPADDDSSMDHSTMDHSEMDHSRMDHSMPAAESETQAKPEPDHTKHHAEHDHGDTE